jgi:MFS family permease
VPNFFLTKKADFSFIDFVKQAQFTNYGLLVLYLGFINYAVYMSAPFFTVFMLEDLKLSYWNFTIVTAAALIVKYLSMPIWGKACDKYGTRKVLSLGGFLMPLVPILWLFNHNVWYLILIQIYSGFVWGAFDMAASTFIFDATSPEKRATCVAYYNVLNGIFIFVGAMAGTLLVRYNQVFWSKYLFIFLLSGLLRYIISFVFVPKLKEVRPVEHIPYTDLLFHVASTMTTHGFKYNFFTFNRRDKK